MYMFLRAARSCAGGPWAMNMNADEGSHLRTHAARNRRARRASTRAGLSR
jgi:hypothetical protein